MRFIEGQVYRYEQIAEHSFPPRGSAGSCPPDTLFIYSIDPVTRHGVFDELMEPENPLVDSMASQLAVEQLRERGLTFRQISRLAGVSVEAVHRAAGGVGRVRRSTERALEEVPARTAARTASASSATEG